MYTIEVARIDHTYGDIRAHEEDRVELACLEGSRGSIRTWWGERIKFERRQDGLTTIDLRDLRSLRDEITGKKGDRRFIMTLGASTLQLSSDWLLLVRRDNWSR